MEFADFAVEIEKVLADLTTQYECATTDEDDIGMLWNFIYEDTVEGFILVEKDAPPFQIPTITITLHLGEVNGAPEEFLKYILGMNMVLINATLAIISTPSLPNGEQEENDDVDEDDEETENESTGFVDELAISTKMPYEAFTPEELADYLNLLVAQSDFVMDALEEFNKEME